MFEARLMSVLNVSKLVKEIKTMILDLTAMSENNKESVQRDKKKSKYYENKK